MATATTALEQLPGIRDVRDCRPALPLQLLVLAPAPEFVLVKAYEALREDGTLEQLFFEALPDREHFLAWLRSPGVGYAVGLACSTLNESSLEVAGLGVVWGISPLPDGSLRAEVGHAFRRKFQVAGIPQQLAVRMLDYAFGPLGIELLAGVTPVINRPAMRFIESMGFRRSHVIPRYRAVHSRPSDCLVSVMSAGEWKEKSRDLR